MIKTDQELQVTLERIAHFQKQVAHLRNVETNPVNYRLAVSGVLAEIDRMNLEVREYLSLLPSELEAAKIPAEKVVGGLLTGSREVGRRGNRILRLRCCEGATKTS